MTIRFMWLEYVEKIPSSANTESVFRRILYSIILFLLGKKVIQMFYLCDSYVFRVISFKIHAATTLGLGKNPSLH